MAAKLKISPFIVAFLLTMWSMKSMPGKFKGKHLGFCLSSSSRSLPWSRLPFSRHFLGRRVIIKQKRCLLYSHRPVSPAQEAPQADNKTLCFLHHDGKIFNKDSISLSQLRKRLLGKPFSEFGLSAKDMCWSFGLSKEKEFDILHPFMCQKQLRNSRQLLETMSPIACANCVIFQIMPIGKRVRVVSKEMKGGKTLGKIQSIVSALVITFLQSNEESKQAERRLKTKPFGQKEGFERLDSSSSRSRRSYDDEGQNELYYGQTRRFAARDNADVLLYSRQRRGAIRGCKRSLCDCDTQSNCLRVGNFSCPVSDCELGFQPHEGGTCESVCPENKYGLPENDVPICQYPCTCKSGACHALTGECLNSCTHKEDSEDAMSEDSSCIKAICPRDKAFPMMNCSYTCYCHNGHSCDPYTGRCRFDVCNYYVTPNPLCPHVEIVQRVTMFYFWDVDVTSIVFCLGAILGFFVRVLPCRLFWKKRPDVRSW